MNKRQKEVLQVTLKEEQAVLNELKSNYTKALADIKKNIAELQANPLTQSKAYQLEFQKQLETQISGIIDVLGSNNFKSVADYLQKSYTTGFVGSMYDMQGQGVPLVIPIDETQVLKAVQKTGDDFKLSNKKGISTKELKKQVQSELTRGLATQLSYSDIARNISDYGLADMRRAETIARTEGHRVQNEARYDSMQAAKAKGADVVKQWDSTLDGKTRPEHRQLDGQVRELDEPFEVAGYKGQTPGGFGSAYMDCNCRCCMLQRARWAVSKEKTYTKWNNQDGGFIECSGYEDFKQKYIDAAAKLKNSQKSATIKESEFVRDETITSKMLKQKSVEYQEVQLHTNSLNDEEIINLVSGGDMTSGSCASVALAYAGQKQGLNVLDFRGGSSMDYFSSKANKVNMFKDLGVESIVADSAKSNLTNGKRILEQLEQGKEYYLSVGRHAAIVRNNEGVLQYLELQSARPDRNGWQDFGDVKTTLQYRFGCSTSSRYYSKAYATDISQLTGDKFRTILGYINTGNTKQLKGAAGNVK